MAKKMLIDAGQPEETRVVVAQGNRVEEFEFESSIRKQLKGNIYLAKVTRVEPSLQAAFVEYGGNRHGFLPLSEIHPDYYQIPLADREALLAEEAADAAAMAAEEDQDEEEKAAPKARNRRRRRNNRKKDPAKSQEASDETANEDAPEESEAQAEGSEEPADQAAATDATSAVTDELTPETAQEEAPAQAEPASAPEDDSNTEDNSADASDDSTEASEDSDGKTQAAENPSERISDDDAEEGAPEETGEQETDEATSEDQSSDENDDEDAGDDEAGDETAEDESVESVGADDDDERAQKRRQTRRRNYRIQEVIRRRQILLIQVVKEERGNKGAALTTYLSIAGRYCVLMPNTARGGGISRKITQAADRKRLKAITNDLELPTGMGLIVRTAGAQRTKAEIKRDFDYLIRLWDNIRELTLKSVAPCLIYEESNLIQRAIRDMYSKDVDTVMVQGEDAYRQAKDFMKMLMPSHAKNVQPYRDRAPLFQRFQVDTQLDQLLEPVVQLKSGGYLVINPTEALVSIDVNSGRSTKEKNVEDTAHATNLEAAEEIARQLRMRDLAGLIVIDFIDMEDNRNRKSVERKMKDALKTDRARIQVGRISHFGLLEMSRQRLGSSLIETYTMQCPSCEGTGTVRTIDAAALKVMRGIEEEAARGRAAEVSVTINPDIAVYILNHKRAYLSAIEDQYGLNVLIVADSSKTQDEFELQKTRNRTRKDREEEQTTISATTFHPDESFDDQNEADEPATEEVEQSQEQEQSGTDDEDDKPKRRRRRRRRRRKPNENGETGESSSDTDGENADENGDESSDSEPAKADAAPAPEANEPASDEPVANEVTAQETVTDPAPQAQEPQLEAPKVEDAAPDEPVAEEPKAEEAKAEEQKPEEQPDDNRPKKRGWWQRRG